MPSRPDPAARRSRGHRAGGGAAGGTGRPAVNDVWQAWAIARAPASSSATGTAPNASPARIARRATAGRQSPPGTIPPAPAWRRRDRARRAGPGAAGRRQAAGRSWLLLQRPAQFGQLLGRQGRHEPGQGNGLVARGGQQLAHFRVLPRSPTGTPRRCLLQHVGRTTRAPGSDCPAPETTSGS